MTADKEDPVWAVLDTEFAELARVLDATPGRFTGSHDRLRSRCLGCVDVGSERARRVPGAVRNGRPPAAAGR
jgi:hypothetical protein